MVTQMTKKQIMKLIDDISETHDYICSEDLSYEERDDEWLKLINIVIKTLREMTSKNET